MKRQPSDVELRPLLTDPDIDMTPNHSLNRTARRRRGAPSARGRLAYPLGRRPGVPSSRSWEELSTKYEALSVRPDPLRHLLELAGATTGSRRCRRYNEFSISAAEVGRRPCISRSPERRKVTEVDKASRLSRNGKLRDATKPKFCVGDLSNLSQVEALSGQKFDTAVCFRAIGYSADLLGNDWRYTRLRS